MVSPFLVKPESADTGNVVLMLCYARSGGTLLNRCLGSLPGTVVLSEVSPFRGERSQTPPLTVREQASRWYGIGVGSDDFAGATAEVAQQCAAEGKQLVVRGWPVADFVPMKQNAFDPPGRLEEYHLLAERLTVRPFVFTRDAIDVWISNGRHRDFFRNFHRYAEAVKRSGFPLLKYEDFCLDPKGEMRRLCEMTGLPYSERFLRFHDFHHVLGDVRMRRPSRGGRLAAIRALPRMHIPARDIRWCEENADMKSANSLFSYPPSYYGRRRGPVRGRILVEIRDAVDRLFRRPG
jgi:hypothetical protein